MDAIEALKTRRSIRSFTNEPVPEEIIEDLINCGRMAATARNVQPWEFVVISDPDRRARLAKVATTGPFIAEAPLCIVVLCADTKYYLEDGCAATQNLLVAAHAHGLGSCWVAGDKKEYAAEVLSILEAPVNYKLVSLVAIGYTAETSRAMKRSPSELTHRETF